MSLSRLADYFIIVGYDHKKSAGSVASGKVIQRFPETDWDKCPFTPGIEPFCQPGGWQLKTQKSPPTFFVSVLTDIDAYRHYCACLSFSEDVVIDTLPKEEDDDDDDSGGEGGVVRCSKLYAPKCLALVSRLNCFEVFRNCLGIMYATYIDNLNISFENIVSTILSSVHVPPYGGAAVKFSLGAGDRQFIQPPSSSSLPVTGTSVALLFEQLGISNTITIFCAALSDHKILLHSLSYSRLTDSSNALTALMYPLKYSYVYIPLLPVALLEVLNAPTPFIAGVHTSHKPDNSELVDVVIADLDGGSLTIPENMQVPLMPQPMLDRVKNSLQMILRPDLKYADMAFSSSIPSLSQPEILDKEIRAVFLRLFAELFLNYRPCLNIIRIHPEPVITFHKASFLGNRGLIGDEFSKRVVGSMSFNSFVIERGPPYRVCDLFDDVFDKLQETLASETGDPGKIISNINALANKLYLNEHPDRSSPLQKIPCPTEGSHLRVHQPLFPILDASKIHALIQENISKQTLANATRSTFSWQQYPRIVPTGTRLTQSQTDKAQLVSTNARRLEVLKSCVAFVFENKISDARKIFPAVLKVLKSKVARLLLVEELSQHVKSNRCLLEHQQFDLVVKLLNSALQNESVMDENGVAAGILPLTTSFCRKLYTGVIQFAYTCVQDHAVWSSQPFWEASFHQDVQHQICQLYQLPEKNDRLSMDSDSVNNNHHDGSLKDGTLKRSDSRRWSSLVLNPPNHLSHQQSITALEIAAEQMRLWPNLSAEEKQEKLKNEESTVYSQAIHYANRMVYLRIPLDVLKHPKDSFEGKSMNSMVTNSAADSDSMEGESRSEEVVDMNEIGLGVEKFVDKFVEKMCQETAVSSEHVNSLKQMVRGVIQMHMETLEGVQQEIARLPPMPKPRIMYPILLEGEQLVMDALRAYLLPDGREDGSGGVMGGPSHLPAEGAIFLTTYRFIFKGTSCDPLVSDHTICRSFPIAALKKDKILSSQNLTHKDIWLHVALQLWSSTFQMIKVAFDEEVSSGEMEWMRKMLLKLRHPTTIMSTFAFTGANHSTHRTIPYIVKNDKQLSLKNYAKKKLMWTMKRGGTKQKEYSQAGSRPSGRYPNIHGRFDLTLPTTHDLPMMFTDDLSVINEHEVKARMMSEARNLERLAERLYCKDFQRLGLGSLYSSSIHHPIRPRPDQFRLSLINSESSYAICPSYPSVLPVPYLISDDSIQKICKSHRHNRFPIATWRHPSTKALLLRASCFHGKGVMGVLKGHYNNPAATTQVDGVATSVRVEQEKYLSAIISCTPQVKAPSFISSNKRKTTNPNGKQYIKDLDKYNTTSQRETLKPHNHTPTALFDRFQYKMAFKKYQKEKGTLTNTNQPPVPQQLHHHSNTINNTTPSKQHHSLDANLSDYCHNLCKSSLYVLGEKTQIKGLGIESLSKCDFVPIEFNDVRQVKASFKKLMPACVPINIPLPQTGGNDQSGTDGKRGGLFKGVQESAWLTQIENILKVAGLIADLIDLQGSSVMVCLEDGWDFTAQVVSVAQILLDPYYRTIEGFKVLVEKEWLAFGHRFSHRSKHTTANQPSSFAPIFLQFLDVIHQIHTQFPMSFEFNQFYLRFLAHHCFSNRFRTFMLDSELRRVEMGWLMKEQGLSVAVDLDQPSANDLPDLSSQPPSYFNHNHHNSDLSLSSEAADTLTHLNHNNHGNLHHHEQLRVACCKPSSLCIWNYIEYHHNKSPVFYNFFFGFKDIDIVLRPCSNLSNLRIWEYYLSEDLSTGCPYDLELRDFDLRFLAASAAVVVEDDAANVNGSSPACSRHVVNSCYDNLQVLQPDSFNYMLMEIFRLESDLNEAPPTGGWIDQWKSMEMPTHPITTPATVSNNQSASSWEEQRRRLVLQQSNHRKLTVEILYGNKQPNSSPAHHRSIDEEDEDEDDKRSIFHYHHSFTPYYYTTPSHCDYCSQVLWGLIKSGYHCSDCGYNCHEKCRSLVPNNCSGTKSISDLQLSTHSHPTTNNHLTNSQSHPSSNKRDSSKEESYLKFSTASTEHRTHEGYLQKRGVMFKGWKMRYFVLDSVKHQLRYYDFPEDNHCKGYIDLAEVESVNHIKNVPGAPKKSEEGAIFELKTTRRQYHFYASNKEAVNGWVDKIQHCI